MRSACRYLTLSLLLVLLATGCGPAVTYDPDVSYEDGVGNEKLD